MRTSSYILILGTFLHQRVSSERKDVDFGTVYSVIINNSTEYDFVFPSTSTHYPHRVNVWSENSSQDFPVLIVVRQQRDILSWQVPLLVESQYFGLYYLNTSRTLCHPNMDIINQLAYDQLPDVFNSSGIQQTLLLSVSTSFTGNVVVNVQAEEETEFYAQKDRNQSLAVSPSQPRYFYYKFTENDTDSVVIEADSEDDICLTISVQDSSCPVFDLKQVIRFNGKFATINRKGGMTIMKNDFTAGFFLVFVVNGDNSECSEENSAIPAPRMRRAGIRAENRTSVVTFTIKSGLSRSDYITASLVTIAVAIIFALISAVLTCICFRYGRLAFLLSLGSCTDFDDDGEVKLTENEKEIYLTNKELCVSQLSRTPIKNKRKSFNYLWHIMSIALFYSIPVVQLVITYQRVLNYSGNLDICYYNFLCAHPALGLSDFNHVFSNIGYVLIGIFYLILVIYRQSSITPMKGHGIPIHYGFFYAMGVGLIIEGILSACYHICPSQSNYQFDLSFMYILAILIMVKLYHNRHPDINASAYATFSVIGIGIFAAMIGILNGNLWIWILFVVAYVCFGIYLSFKIYFFSFVLAGLKKLRDDIVNFGFSTQAFAPVKRARFILLCFANLLNYVMVAFGVYSYFTSSTDFGTFLLAILMANAILYASFYIAMKLIHKEKVCLEATLFGILAIITWGISSYFFLDYSTLWNLTPAESRQKNQNCSLMGFYDSHDIWHLLSAAALFFTFMFMLNLDDDLALTPQDDIPVF